MFFDAALLFALYTWTPLAPMDAALLPHLVPAAEYLGVASTGRAVADQSFRSLHPDLYRWLQNQLPGEAGDRLALDAVQTALRHTLFQQQRTAVITARHKTLYSTWRKMERKQQGFDGIVDRLAARVRLATVQDCHDVLTALHGRFQHDPTEFDDYIVNPKPNGYASILTVLHVPTAVGMRPVEVQLRTHAMHAAAEHGDAAHWAYKRSLAA